MNPIQPGWKTSEFWISSVATLIGVLASVGVIAPDQVSVLNTEVGQIVGGIVAVIAIVQYIRSRTAVKVAGIKSGQVAIPTVAS